ncbi:hypothetical protein SAMN05877753_103116 [Bacillus oleivorans]|uniref:t-SNARE coiled-coil homology domain-containing protein n=1 Tax=Bacillus oleivorans TaxID=1448271 RepID=A0A285CPS9_9BACI|nr:hypothetical protein [Bacillus oleivorans]SNX69562.1 hypothetical protein SAMN05877753_103116 [Bacillus oleivorans]
MKNEELIIQAIKELNENMLNGFNEMDKKFEEIDKRFEGVDMRFEAIDKRFEGIDKRFDRIEERLERIENEQKNFRKDISFLSEKIGEHDLILNRITSQ